MVVGSSRKGNSMKTILILMLLLGAFVAGVLASPHVASTRWGDVNLRAIGEAADFWANRYQTFLGVVVAVIVAYLTIAAMGKQNAISERQFLTGQMQSLTNDRANLQFVVAQLNELKFQKRLFENNIAFLENEGDKTVGWQNGGNLIRTAFTNVEGFRSLVGANTAKFLGPTAVRTELLARLDEIVNSQDRVRDAFMSWANLNRQQNAEPAAPPTAQKEAYSRVASSVIALFDTLAPAASAAVTELNKKIDQTEKDIAGLQAAIDAKAKD